MSARRGVSRSIVTDVSGASAVEFAMIATPLIMIIFGLVQVGWALHCASSVRYALDESARVLSLDPEITAADVEATMRERLEILADPDISVSISEDQEAPGLRMTSLRATYVHSLSVPMLPTWNLRFESVALVARPTL